MSVPVHDRLIKQSKQASSSASMGLAQARPNYGVRDFQSDGAVVQLSLLSEAPFLALFLTTFAVVVYGANY